MGANGCEQGKKINGPMISNALLTEFAATFLNGRRSL